MRWDSAMQMQHKELMEAGKEIAESRQAAVKREAPETDVGAHGLLETMSL
jgi:hypothetical protein